MNGVIKKMLDRYNCHSWQDHEQALREILQEIALVGLWRSKFFEHAAFYGGTALRIFYGLDRFSEDLDFTLITTDPDWTWKPYGNAMINELTAYGFEVSFVEKEKKQLSAVKSAFLKTSTVQELLKVGIQNHLLKGVHSETLIRIKVEIDTTPPFAYPCEQRFMVQPVGVSIRCVNEECLFACKMHAALFRTWKGRVKGRDWYDLEWFIRKRIPLNLVLFSKLHAPEAPSLNQAAFLKMIEERIDRLDVSAAIEDIIHFIKDPEAIKRTWSKDYFRHLVSQLIFIHPSAF